MYDVGSKNFIGEITLLQHKRSATHTLVFVLGWMSSGWKQVVVYYFTGNMKLLSIHK